MANRAIKYRIYPTSEQEIFFAKSFGCCRKIWNLMLADKVASYKETGSFGNQTPAMYKREYPYLKEVDSLALANMQLNLQAAMKNCFEHGHCRFPKHKSFKKARKSYTTNNQKGTVRLVGNQIKLPKIGFVKAVIHRKPREGWEIKSATVSMDRDGSYYISLLFEYDKADVEYTPSPENAIGLDYKSDGLYMGSNGVVGSGHKFFREGQRKLAKEQKRLSRKVGSKKGETRSKNFEKQLRKVNRQHKRIANQRNDYLHKKSTEIANQYDIVCVESLNMKAMSNKGFGNGKATLDNGYGKFLTMLEYKLEERRKLFVKVDKWYASSQLCSQCGSKKKLALFERIYQCDCGLRMDRDLNAAINVKIEGLRLLNVA